MTRLARAALELAAITGFCMAVISVAGRLG
jgi:hypothetical protein